MPGFMRLIRMSRINKRALWTTRLILVAIFTSMNRRSRWRRLRQESNNWKEKFWSCHRRINESEVSIGLAKRFDIDICTIFHGGNKIMNNRISINPDICNGRPVITGTRILVKTVIEFLGAGDSIEEVLEEYPSLKREDIYACMQFAARLMANYYEVRKIA